MIIEIFADKNEHLFDLSLYGGYAFYNIDDSDFSKIDHSTKKECYFPSAEIGFNFTKSKHHAVLLRTARYDTKTVLNEQSIKSIFKTISIPVEIGYRYESPLRNNFLLSGGVTVGKAFNNTDFHIKFNSPGHLTLDQIPDLIYEKKTNNYSANLFLEVDYTLSNNVSIGLRPEYHFNKMKVDHYDFDLSGFAINTGIKIKI